VSRASARVCVALAFYAAAIGCGRGSSSSATLSQASPFSDAGTEPLAPPAPMDPRERAQWAAAAEGDPEELMRLANLVGCEGLRERALADASLRRVALRAAAYCPDLSELPWLAEVAGGSDDADARAALEAIGDLAAAPRRATDPEDAADLREGCTSLLALSRAAGRAKERRVLAIGALRMLADRGCVKRADIPTDLDAR
jgi:hypothetical protein